MRLLTARRPESDPRPADDRYLQVFDSWFADLAIGEGPISRHELIDQLLDLRLRLTTVQQLEDDVAGTPAGESDVGTIVIEPPVDDGAGQHV
jgi:hypothetical protein